MDKQINAVGGPINSHVFMVDIVVRVVATSLGLGEDITYYVVPAIRVRQAQIPVDMTGDGQSSTTKG